MRINGTTVPQPAPVTVTIYRQTEDGQPWDIKFVCGVVLDYTDFDRICPRPTPPLVYTVATGVKEGNSDDPNYKRKVDVWAQRRVNWFILKSLSHTPNLEWDTVKLNEPDTWDKYQEEMLQTLTPKEVSRVVEACFEANDPSAKRRDEALANFTHTHMQQEVTA